jgi:hypothetical protein
MLGLAAGAAVVCGQGVRGNIGSHPYTPTRIEWMLVRGNAVGRTQLNAANIPWIIDYQSGDDDDSIVIVARYSRQISEKDVALRVDEAKAVIHRYAFDRGWSKKLGDWPKVEEVRIPEGLPSVITRVPPLKQ